MTGYSEHIYAIEAWLKRNGVSVWTGPPPEHVPDFVSGSYDHDAEFIDGRPRGPAIAVYCADSRVALMCLAHEAGHWLGYLINRKPYSHQRERQAYVYGWHVLQWFKAPISRDEWREECRRDAAHKRKEDPEFTSRK